MPSKSYIIFGAFSHISKMRIKTTSVWVGRSHAVRRSAVNSLRPPTCPAHRLRHSFSPQLWEQPVPGVKLKPILPAETGLNEIQISVRGPDRGVCSGGVGVLGANLGHLLAVSHSAPRWLLKHEHEPDTLSGRGSN